MFRWKLTQRVADLEGGPEKIVVWPLTSVRASANTWLHGTSSAFTSISIPVPAFACGTTLKESSAPVRSCFTRPSGSCTLITFMPIIPTPISP